MHSFLVEKKVQIIRNLKAYPVKKHLMSKDPNTGARAKHDEFGE